MTRLIKAIQIGLVSLLFILLCCTGKAYARGGCFGFGTSVLTVDGYKYIENLSLSDQLVGLNLSNDHIEVESIGGIQVAQVSDYYLLNGATQVTGTHPFYVQKSKGLELVEVHDLKVGDHLIGEQNAHIEISSIQYIKAPLKTYNLIDITPYHNFYADSILVHNKGAGGGGTSGGSSGYGGHGVATLNKKTLPGFILAVLLLVFGLMPLAFFKEIYNLIRFRNKTFTHDSDLIEFTNTINEKFSNTYSARYSKDNETWNQIDPSEELNPAKYQHFVSQPELVDSVSHLFVTYQSDWAKKNFDGMVEYSDQPFYKMQKKIFLDAFGKNFDIVYQPKLHAVVPLSCRQQDDSYIFEFQINAELINFELSSKGYVLSGEAHPRSFTEYWTIRIDSVKRYWLMNIAQFHNFSAVVD